MCGIFALLNNSSTFNANHIRTCFSREYGQYNLQYVDDNIWIGYQNKYLNDQYLEQPLTINKITLTFSGEIYNHRHLFKLVDKHPTTQSADSEIIIYLYARYGIAHTLQLLEGVFTFVIHDLRDDIKPLIHVVRDSYGIRPLYMVNTHIKETAIEPFHMFVSDLDVLYKLCDSIESSYDLCVNHVNPGDLLTYSKTHNSVLWHQVNSFDNKNKLTIE
jgi:asparagine synthetase B (glutamine-hydrolysing)